MIKFFIFMLFFCQGRIFAGDGFKYENPSPLDYSFILLCAALVFMMQLGFMCLESGLCQKKNSINVAVKNLTDFMISSFIFWLIGFGIMFGNSVSSFIGCSEFASNFPTAEMGIFFLFQMMFCGAASTINSGAIAGRAKFSTYIMMSVAVSGFIYPVFGHWAWSGLWSADNSGWLESLGFMDFAGSTVVHSLGGWVALAAVIVIGPRKDKFDENRKARKINPSSYLMAYIGIFLLTFGWFGFNAGSRLKVDQSIVIIIINTLLAASSGGISAMFYNWWVDSEKIPEPENIGNGLLGGLVAITACCAWVSPASAVLIGTVAGIITVFSINYIENKLKLDDVVGAISVHGVCGVWGALALALFSKEQFLSMPRFSQLGVQMIGVFVCFVWSFGTSWLVFKFLHDSYSLRVSLQDEIKGLNLSEHNVSESEK